MHLARKACNQIRRYSNALSGKFAATPHLLVVGFAFSLVISIPSPSVNMLTCPFAFLAAKIYFYTPYNFAVLPVTKGFSTGCLGFDGPAHGFCML